MPVRPRIMFVTQSLGKGGAERLVLEISRAFSIDFPEVSVKIVALAPDNDYQTLSEGLDIEYCNSRVQLSITGKSVIDTEAFDQIVDVFKPDVIHSHTYKAELVSRERPRKGIVYVTHVHADFPEFEPLGIHTLFSKKKLANYFERYRLLKKYRMLNNQFITISKTTDSKLRDQLSRRWHENIRLMPNVIDYAKFAAEPRTITDNTIEMISVGRFYPVKQHTYLLDVLAELKKSFPVWNWKLTFPGEGPLREQIKQRADEMGLGENMVFTGLIHDVETYLKKSQIYLHSAASEPFGLVIVEAMAASLPVVTLDGGGNRDFIRHGTNGYIFPQGTSPEVFAVQINNLVSDKELYASIAKEAGLTARDHDVHPYVKKLMEFYNSKIVETNAL